MNHHARPTGSTSDTGSAALSHVVALGSMLVFLALCTQILLWSYARGAVRAAAQEAAGAAALPGSTASDCEIRFAEVIDGLLGGTIGDGVGRPVCRVDAQQVVLEVELRFGRWLPGGPHWGQVVVATAPRPYRADGPG